MRSQKGFTLVELLIAMAIVAVISAGLYSMIRDQAAIRRAGTAAQELQLHAKAAEAYVRNNYGALVAAAGGGPVSVTAAQLQSANLLPAGIASTNAYGQTTRTVVRLASPGTLEAIVVTEGGTAIPEQYAADAAQRLTELGAAGGYTPSASPTTLRGAMGSWTANLTPYGVAPGPGRLAANLFYASASYADTYLHRVAEPGRPELNTMSTNLNMGGNSIGNANNIQAATATLGGGNSLNIGGSFVYGDATNLAVRVDGALYVQNKTATAAADVNASSVNAAGWVRGGAGVVGTGSGVYSSNWFRSWGDTGWYNETYGGGWHMSDPSWIRAYNDKSIFTNGTVLAGTLQSGGRITAGEYVQINGTATFGAGCAPDGLLGKSNTTGEILTCRGGIWRGVGGVTESMVVYSPNVSYGYGSWAYATCPAGYTLTGGGYHLVWRRDSNTNVSPWISMQIAGTNSWGVLANDQISIYAVATCSR